MKEFLRNVENPNVRDGAPQPKIIDIIAEEVSFPTNSASAKDAPPAWFKNLKEDFIAEQVDVRPLNKSHYRRPKSLRSIKLQPKKRFSSLKLVVGISGILLFGFFAYQFSFQPKAIALPSHVNEQIGLNQHTNLSNQELERSLTILLKDFYNSQAPGNFEFANFFSDKTELYYSEENPTIEQIRDAYNKRLRKMNDLKQSLVPSSLQYYRNGSEVILTYWVEINYVQKLYNKEESADVKNEMIIDENGKIISLKQVEVKNFKSSDIVDINAGLKKD